MTSITKVVHLLNIELRSLSLTNEVCLVIITSDYLYSANNFITRMAEVNYHVICVENTFNTHPAPPYEYIDLKSNKTNILPTILQSLSVKQ